MARTKQTAAEIFHLQLLEAGLLGEREYKFHPIRRWRIDYAWPEYMLAVEIEGAIWTQGRHTRGSGFLKDLEKYNTLTLLGWRLLRFSGEWVKHGSAIEAVRFALLNLPKAIEKIC